MAFSAGVDSTFLLKCACDVLGIQNVLAVTADSLSFSSDDLEAAKRVAREIGARQLIIKTDEFGDENFLTNPLNRCYFCKKDLYQKLILIAQREQYFYVVDGFNVNDLSDFRPGHVAAKELEVRHPLHEAGFAKEEIRDAAKVLGLSVWDRPAEACLASRFPYNTRITKEAVKKVELAEKFLKQLLNVDQVRVRFHGNIARIELKAADLSKVFLNGSNKMIVAKLKEFGFNYVTLDLEGYRAGSLNEAVSENSKQNVSLIRKIPLREKIS